MAINTVEQGSAEIFRKIINDNFSYLDSKNNENSQFIVKINEDISGIKTNIESLQNNIEEVKVLIGSVPPSNSTKGSLGQSYLDTTAKKMYQCVNISGSIYTWKASSGSSAIISKEPPEDIQNGDVWYQII